MTSEARRNELIREIGAMRRYARALTRDPARADDLVQDALLRAIQGADRLRDGAPLRPWLLTIVHNGFIDMRRAEQAEGRRREAVASDPVTPPGQEHAVRLGQVAAAFAALPPEQRAVLHLVTVEGLSYAEAAVVLDVPIGTLMSRLGRARAALRAMEAGSGDAGTPRLRLVGGGDDDAG
ncbi:MAG: sigma-70 family RNA polymerase sigma factor [Zavarzinia sp.]|nr:sigma-70 family RNA polymerase sigma factor [Zavarzinia sp.]